MPYSANDLLKATEIEEDMWSTFVWGAGILSALFYVIDIIYLVVKVLAYGTGIGALVENMGSVVINLIQFVLLSIVLGLISVFFIDNFNTWADAFVGALKSEFHITVDDSVSFTWDIIFFIAAFGQELVKHWITRTSIGIRSLALDIICLLLLSYSGHWFINIITKILSVITWIFAAKKLNDPIEMSLSLLNPIMGTVTKVITWASLPVMLLSIFNFIANREFLPKSMR